MCITSCALLFAGPLGRPPFLFFLRPGITRGAFLDTTTNESMDSCDMLGAVKVQLLRESEHQHRGMCSSKNVYIAGAPRQTAGVPATSMFLRRFPALTTDLGAPRA